MLKRDTLNAASAKTLGEAFKCGECLHHSRSCHPHRESPCSKLGVRSFAVAPKVCFTPDVTKLFQNSEQFVVLANLFNSYTPAQRKILCAVLKGAKTKEAKPKKGSKGQPSVKDYKFGTKLYLCLGKDVLTNYRCGYVVGQTSTGELILTGSADRKSAGNSFFAYLKTTEGLLTHKEWVAKKQELIDSGKIDTLKIHATPAHYDKYLNYEVPSIDTSPEAFAAKPSRRRNKRTAELTDIFTVSE